MTEPGGWTTPEGWGPPTPPAPSGPPPADGPGSGQPASYGQQAYGQHAYGQGPGMQSTYGYRPDVKPGVVPLRPLGLGELLDGAVGVLRRYPRPTLGAAAVVAVVTALVNVVLLLTAFRPFVQAGAAADLQSGSMEALEAAIGGAAVGGLLTGGLTLLSGAILTGVLTVVVGKAVLGQPLTLSQAWAQVRPALLRLVGVAVLLALIAGGAAFLGTFLGVVVLAVGGPVRLLGVPLILVGLVAAVYLYFRLSLAPCALVLEKVGVGTSLRRSWLLVKGDWWRVFGISLLTMVVALFVSLVIQVPFELFGYGSVSDLTGGGGDALSARTLLFSSIGGIVASTLVDPFTAGVRALLYVDRRMRAEGLDVALTAAAADPRT